MTHFSTLARTFLAAFPFILASCSHSAGPPAASPAAPAPPALCPVVPPKVSFIIGQDDHTLTRLDNDKPTWTRRFDGRLGGVRDPHIVSDDTRVFVTSYPHLIALDAKTGSTLWTSDGPTDRLFLSGNLLLATDCSRHDGPHPEPRFVMARAVDTGREVFRITLPALDFDPQPFLEINGIFVAQNWETPDGVNSAIFFDRQGNLLARRHHQIISGLPEKNGTVFLTSHELEFIGAAGQGWLTPFAGREWLAGGTILRFPDGDLIASLYGSISDSGARIMRVDPKTGRPRWEIQAAPLGVPHSEYYHHVTVSMREGILRIDSHGSYGDFTEFRTNDGQLLQRLDPESPKSSVPISSSPRLPEDDS